MKLRSHKPSFKKPIIIAVTIVLLAVSAGFLWLRNANNQSIASREQDTSANTTQAGNINYDPPTDEEKQEGEQIKEQTINPSPAPDTPPTITITRAGQVTAQQPVAVRTFVTGTNSGTCIATFTQAGQPTLTRIFTITTDATSVLCNGDIPASEFTVGGQWQLSIVAKSNSGTVSSPATQSVNVIK